MAPEALSVSSMALNSGPFRVSTGSDLNGSILDKGGLILASVMEDMLQQQGTRLSDVDLASRKAEEAAARRYQAAGWLRKMVGFVGAKDLPAEPSEEEFRLGLRSGSILCNVLNKVRPGAVPKVVENPVAAIPPPDGAALSAYQYFENVRNFLVAVEDLRLPTFEASDLEQGGKCARVVNCVLALQSYSDWKQTGGSGLWKYSGNLKPSTSGKYVVKLGNNSDLFTNSLSRNKSQMDLLNEKYPDGFSNEQNLNGDMEMVPHSMNMLVRTILLDKKPEEVPILVESMLSKVMKEFERRLASQSEQLKRAVRELVASDDMKPPLKAKVLSSRVGAFGELKMDTEQENTNPKAISFQRAKNDECFAVNTIDKEASKSHILKQQALFDQQQRHIEELKHAVRTTKAGMQFMQMRYSEEFCNLGKHVHMLACAASGYHKVFEENRKLYNQVQDLKGSIRVYCRVRPFLPGKRTCLSTVDYIGDGIITICNPLKQGKVACRSFNFNKVFGPSASQEEVFSDTKPLIRSVLDGYNVCIFAYGQTGSGKTYTMSGPREITDQSEGVNYRALSDLFHISEQRRDTFSYDVAVQMIEIYNEQVRDLLVTDGLNKKLEIRNSSQQKGLNVPDANLVPVASTSDVIELMNVGHRNRAVGATAMNDRSSRSHSCLTVHVQGRDLTSGAVLRGCLHLVDLAGSERVEKSEATGERLKEAQHINKSLSALGDVISSLAQKNSHIPYRNSKLTQLLQDSLGGHAKTLMFVHISPEIDAFGETVSTLKFAERVATVELGAARLNKEGGDVRELKEQIASLKAALAQTGEPEQLRSTRSSPDRHRTRTAGPSPVHLNRQGGEMSASHSNHRQPMEEVGNIEVRNKSAGRPKRLSLENQDLLRLTNSTLWSDNSPGLNYVNGEEREAVPGNWVDKVMVNKQEPGITDNDPLSCWEGSSGPLPDLYYQSIYPDTRTYHDQQYGMQQNHFEMGTTDESELEVVTSDSSEADLLWQYNLPHVTSATSGGGSRLKMPQPRITKSPDIRTPDQVHGSLLSRKLSNGATAQSLPRSGRQPVSGGAAVKRSFSGGKLGSGK